MALLKLQHKRSDGVSYLDRRPSYYYNKFQYKVRYHCQGITLCWWSKSIADIEKRSQGNKHYRNADLPEVKKFYKWMKEHKKSNLCTIRIEGNTASVFSNDLKLLQGLLILGKNADLVEVDNRMELGVKWFVNEPKHKYRIYLKGKRIDEKFSIKLGNFFKRYEGTDTKISPCPSLKKWLVDSQSGAWKLQQSFYSWKMHYTSGHYFFDYDDESMITLFGLTFGDMIHKKYELKKQPESI